MKILNSKEISVNEKIINKEKEFYEKLFNENQIYKETINICLDKLESYFIEELQKKNILDISS